MVAPRSGIGSLDGCRNTIKRLPEKSRPPQRYRGNLLSESSGIAASSITQGGGGGGAYAASAVHFEGISLTNLNAIAGLPATANCLLVAGWLGNFSENSFFEFDVLGAVNVFQILQFTSAGDNFTAVQLYGKDVSSALIFDLENTYTNIVDL